MVRTRLQSSLANEESNLASILDQIQTRIGNVNTELKERKVCYFCMDNDEPLSFSTSQLLLCGHGYHQLCAIQARNTWYKQSSRSIQGEGDGTHISNAILMLECGMCRYQLKGNDTIDLLGADMKLCRIKETRMMPSGVSDVAPIADARRRDLEKIGMQIENAEGILSGRYKPDRPPPTSHDGDCRTM